MTSEIEKETDIINKMSREEMCYLWRFVPPGHKYFQRGTELNDAFEKRFKELGGFSPKISKSIGWEK